MTEFDKELIDLMQSMSEEEVQTILSDPTGYLKSKNPGLLKKHQEYYLEHKREKKPIKVYYPERSSQGII